MVLELELETEILAALRIFDPSSTDEKIVGQIFYFISINKFRIVSGKSPKFQFVEFFTLQFTPNQRMNHLQNITPKKI